MRHDWDLIFVGGGLASGLAAYRLIQKRPGLRVLVLERGSQLGGIHTWSFHDSDLSPSSREWVQPLVDNHWSEHQIFFPSYSRRLASGYNSIRSASFHRRITALLGQGWRGGSEVVSVRPREVRTADGAAHTAPAVIDARGFGILPAPGTVGYQKFLGMEIELAEPHGLTGPILMDATCEQLDGFRFFYVLPWTETSILVEDTHYSDEPAVDSEAYRREIRDYLRRRGWNVQRESYEEIGSLPIPLTTWPGGIDPAVEMEKTGVPAIGMRAGLFHPTTGYSLPDAVRAADAIASLPVLSSDVLVSRLSTEARRAERERRFFRLLNRMLFRGAEPGNRYRILERFYRLPEPLVGRFYAMELGFLDVGRILIGKPPIPVGRALGCLWEKRGDTFGLVLPA